MKKYHYFVSFFVTSVKFMGMTEISTDTKISSFADICAIQTHIAQQMSSFCKCSISDNQIVFYCMPQLIRDEPY